MLQGSQNTKRAENGGPALPAVDLAHPRLGTPLFHIQGPRPHGQPWLEDPVEVWVAYYTANPSSCPKGVRREVDGRPNISDCERVGELLVSTLRSIPMIQTLVNPAKSSWRSSQNSSPTREDTKTSCGEERSASPLTLTLRRMSALQRSFPRKASLGTYQIWTALNQHTRDPPR